MTKPLLVVFLGLIAVAIALFSGHLHNSSRAGYARTASTPHMHPGTVVSIRTAGAGSSIAWRDHGGVLNRIVVGQHAKLTSRDGRTLALANLRPGDHVVVRSTGVIEDESQHVVDVQGIVNPNDDPLNGPMVVTLHQAQDVLVNIGSQTGFSDPSRQTSSRGQISEADIVRVRGVLDDVIGEMTVTDSIARLGPYGLPVHRKVA